MKSITDVIVLVKGIEATAKHARGVGDSGLTFRELID